MAKLRADGPEPTHPVPDWAGLLAMVAEVDAHLATVALAAADANRALLELKTKMIEQAA